MNAHPTAVEISTAVEAERNRLLAMWTKSSDQWARMYIEAHAEADAAMKWSWRHKYLGYPVALLVGALIGHIV
jgi:hypothetical protein